MAVWSKPTKILAFVIILAVVIAAVWLLVRWQQSTEQPDPQEVLAELTLGDVSSSSNVNLPDPTKDATVSYVVASDAQVAAQTGISTIMSKQEIINYYTNWFAENNWVVQSSKQAKEEAYIINARKQAEGMMQINIFTQVTAPSSINIDSGDDTSGPEISGPIQVLILYGFGR